MDFITAQQELAAQLGLDYTQSDTATLLKRWLNFSYQTIVGWKNWTWLQDTDRIKMVADSTETTLAVTASITLATPTTVTFNGAVATSQTGRFIQFEGSNDWYKISAHTAGASTATISPAYVQTTALSAGDFTIRTFYYSLTSTTEKVLNCRRAAPDSRYINIISPDRMDSVDAFSETTGDPTTIYFWGQDSSGNWTFTPYPFPDEPLLLEFRVFKKATELSANSDTPIFPTRFTSAWIDYAKGYGYEHDNDDRKTDAFNRASAMLNKLKGQDRIGAMENNTIEPIDFGKRNIGSTIRFPDQYGVR